MADVMTKDLALYVCMRVRERLLAFMRGGRDLKRKKVGMSPPGSGVLAAHGLPISD